MSEEQFYLFNLKRLYEEMFQDRFWIFIGIISILCLYGLWVMKIIAERHFSSSIDRLSRYFRLSQATAAVTLIAFSNGVEDIISSIIDSNEPNHQVLVLGQILGSFFFCSTIVLSNIVISNDFLIKIPIKLLLKEHLFYLILVTLVLLSSFFQLINFFLLLSLLVFYFTYIWISFKSKFSIEENNESNENITETVLIEVQERIVRNELNIIGVIYKFAIFHFD